MSELFNLDINKPVKKTKNGKQKKSSAANDTVMKDILGDDLVLKKQELPGISTEDAEEETEKILKSKKISLPERLAIIAKQVLTVLGKQKNRITVIKDITTFSEYIDDAIKVGRIAIDTETNNSLDPVTCQLMGLCLYVPGKKQAYVPIHHTDLEGNRLNWQLTEANCNAQLKRIVDSNTFVVMHNGKFDYEVIKCTCDIAVVPNWDTMVAARLLNENELAGLKEQYISKIDPMQAHYKIDKLFENVAYQYVDPEIFALYAATDSFITDKLYELQAEEFAKDEYGPHLDLSGQHEVKGLRWLFHNVEMPIVVVTAEMELAGVKVDTAFGEQLSLKYHKLLDNLDTGISDVLGRLDNIIKLWSLTPIANERTKQFQPKKTKLTAAKIAERYPELDTATGKRFRYGKSRHDQLSFPINLASPVQLGILFYDILGCDATSKKAPRGTGEEELKKLIEQLQLKAEKAEKSEGKISKKKVVEISEEADTLETELSAENFTDKSEKATTTDTAEEINGAAIAEIQITSDIYRAGIDLGNAILERRGIVKLITTYIDVIPTLAKHWPDGRIRFHLNSLGTDTGRYSSGGKIKYYENGEQVTVSGINIQNIPSRGPGGILRMLFTADTKYHTPEIVDNIVIVPETDEVELASGWKLVSELAPGDLLVCDATTTIIRSIVYDEIKKQYSLTVDSAT